MEEVAKQLFLPYMVEEVSEQPPSPRGVEESRVLRRELQQKINNFSKKFILPSLYGVVEPIKQAHLPCKVE